MCRATHGFIICLLDKISKGSPKFNRIEKKPKTPSRNESQGRILGSLQGITEHAFMGKRVKKDGEANQG
jgi:hypothetical protein